MRVDSWDHDKEIKLVKNPDYKGNRKVNNDGVTFKIYTDKIRHIFQAINHLQSLPSIAAFLR